MVRRRATLVLGLLILALTAAACSRATAVPPTAILSTATIAPPTETLVPTRTAALSETVAPTGTPAPADTETPSAPTGTIASPQPPIAHLAAGQVITITTIKMIDAQNGWAVGGTENVGDHVLTTGDGGQTWHDVTPPQPEPSPDQGQPNAAIGYFASNKVTWVVYGIFDTTSPSAPDASVVWRTSDGGQTWAASQPIGVRFGASDFFQPSDLSFLADGQNGWFLAHLGGGMNQDYFTVMHSTDAGQTWAPLFDPSTDGPQGCQKTGLQFQDAKNGWLLGDCEAVESGLFFLRTTDGGATWNDFDLPAPASQPDIFTRRDAGCGSYALRIFDAHNANMAVRCQPLKTNVITSTSFIYASSDAGQTWSSSPAPTWTVTFLDSRTGWALPPDEYPQQAPFALSMTQDGGKTWKTVKQLAWTGLLDFVDANTGWAVARAGDAILLVKSSDGGKTWRAVDARVAE